jgi:glycosyltransferase involved in cell wall biosynthesis
LSVIIPTCDRPDFYGALKSVSVQTFEPHEIIIVDNGIKKSEEYFFKNNKIRYIRALPRFGVSQARNLGVCLAKGTYIAFLDDDDVWDKKYLEEINNIITKTKASIVLGSVKKIENGEILSSKSAPIKAINSFKKELLLRNPGVIGSNTVIKKDVVFKYSKGYDPFLIRGEDKGLVLDIILNNQKIKIIRAENAFIYYKSATKKELQAKSGKIAKGKLRFLMKYRKEMSFMVFVKNLFKYFLLKFRSIKS